MPSTPAEVWLQPLDSGIWESCGKDRLVGITPEPPFLSANEWGSDAARFMLRRETKSVHPDLSAFTPCEVWICGVPVWSGRVWETPTKEGSDAGISVEGRGWQYQLDDDVYTRLFAHSKLPEWRDARAFLGCDLTKATQTPSVETGSGQIILGWQKGSTTTENDAAAVTLDLGPDSTCWAKRVVVTFDALNTASNYGLAIHGDDDDNPFATGESPYSANQATANGVTVAATFTSTRRYVTLIMSRTAATFVGTANDEQLRITSLQVFSATAWESGNASILKASDVVKDALPIAPLLSQDTSLIAATSFSIKDFFFLEPQTPRESLQAANALHNQRLRVDVDRRLRFDTLPTVPVYEAGEWQGVQFEDAASNSGESIYDQVLIQGDGPDGAPLRVKRSQTGTLVDRRGFHRTKILPVGAAIDTATGNQLGDTWLPGHKTTPFRGGATVEFGGFRQAGSGASVHPSVLLRDTQELVRFLDRIDPDTGATGRDARIVAVAYDHAQEQARVSFDNERRNFDALLARYAAVVGGARG